MTGWLRRLVCLSALWAFGMGPALAHKGSDAYLDVQQSAEAAPSPGAGAPAYQDYRFVLAVAIKDLDLLLPIDANADGKVTWGEVKTAMPRVLGLANTVANTVSNTDASTASAPATGPSCRLDWQLDGLDRRGDGTYIRLAAQARCSTAQGLSFRYTLLRDQDANHRLLVAGRVGGRDLLTTASPMQSGNLVLVAGTAAEPDGAKAASAVAQPSSRWSVVRDYLGVGVLHLLQGYDHLAFLLALVLPLQVVLFAGQRRAPAAYDGAPVKGVGWALLRTVTAFTIGHSITLVLATFGWLQASPRWVEPAIALSIAVAALLNLRPVRWVRTDVLALLFGMVHGIGFASLLQEAAAPRALLPWALAGFNVGVEVGQLLAVGAWVLLSQPLVARPWYGSVVVRGGSALLVVLAAWWFWQRVT